MTDWLVGLSVAGLHGTGVIVIWLATQAGGNNAD